ncbi:MAG TPA: ATP synthase subunit I [Burkholderiales bacterium]|nr:ATP synthase subunit I [Burkholderiales bacterium]
MRRNTLTRQQLERYTPRALLGAGGLKAMLRSLGKPIRTVLRWQLVVTAALTLVAAVTVGTHGAVSAALGGMVSLCAGLASGIVASLGKAESAGGVLIGALRAEGIKIGLIVILLWLVLAAYKNVVMLAFVGTFIVTALIFPMAVAVRDR